MRTPILEHLPRVTVAQKLAIIGTMLLIVAVEPAAAQGACSVPNASNGISTFGDLLRSVLVLAGIFVGGKALLQSRSGGEYGKAGARKSVGGALGLVFAGAALPQLASWVLGLFGSSLGAVGLGCMF